VRTAHVAGAVHLLFELAELFRIGVGGVDNGLGLGDRFRIHADDRGDLVARAAATLDLAALFTRRGFAVRQAQRGGGLFQRF
jgi:hypothetical protein